MSYKGIKFNGKILDVPQEYLKSVSISNGNLIIYDNKGVAHSFSIPEGLATEAFVRQQIASLINSAPETLDTLGEIATAIAENETVVEALNSAIGNKADKTALDNYLPLSAGSTKPLTDDLYITSDKQIIFHNDAKLYGNSYALTLTSPEVMIFRIGNQSNSPEIEFGWDYFVPKDGMSLGFKSLPWEEIHGTAIYQNGKQVANKEDIPTVNNATLTIQKNGTSVGTFTANASSNSTVNITVPTGTASEKNVVTTIDTSANLPTSNAVKTFVEGKGYVTSSGSVASANKLTTSRKIGLGTGVTGTATSFDGSGDITIPVTDVKESYLSWGGKNIVGGVSPIGASLSSEHSANRLAYLNPNAINIEYSNNAGTSWIGSGVNDETKINLVTTSAGISIGSNSPVTTNHRTRITLTAQNGTTGYVYTRPRKMLLNISTSGHGLKVLIEAKKGTSSATWETLGTYELNGWSGWNDIPIGISTFGGGTSQTGNYWYMRLTFQITSVNSSYTSSKASIIGVRLFGDTCWTQTSNMGATGHLYSYDSSQNATFPAGVTATTFTGSLNGNATSATNATKLNNQDASYYLNYNNLSNKPTIPTNYIPQGGTLSSPLKVTGGDTATAGKIILDETNKGQITNTSTGTLFGFNNSTQLTIGAPSYATLLRGSATRPTYNGSTMALSSDIPDISTKADLTNSSQTITAGTVSAPYGYFDNISNSLVRKIQTTVLGIKHLVLSNGLIIAWGTVTPTTSGTTVTLPTAFNTTDYVVVGTPTSNPSNQIHSFHVHSYSTTSFVCTGHYSQSNSGRTGGDITFRWLAIGF